MYRKFIILFIAIFLLPQCGFKRLDNSVLFNITNIETTGYQKANFFIKNNLLSKINTRSSNVEIRLNIETKRTKIIAEKNINNEITKYNIKFNTSVDLYFIEKNRIEKFNISESANYRVEKSVINTSKNIDNVERNLSNIISQKIRQKMIILQNDI